MNKTIRICEIQDAVLMRMNGSFRRFLQMWSDKYPYTSRLREVKRYKEEHGCSLKEAMQAVVYQKDVRVSFEIGPDYILRKNNCSFTLFVRVNGIWTKAEQLLSLDTMAADNDYFPIFRLGINHLCTLWELKDAACKKKLEEFAKKVAVRIRQGGKKFCQFCDDEIWRTDEESPKILHIDSNNGTKDIPFTRKGILRHIEEYCSHRLLQDEL